MTIKKITSLVIGLALVLPVFAGAQVLPGKNARETGREDAKNSRQDGRQDARDLRQDGRQEGTSSSRQDGRQDARDSRQGGRQDARDVRQDGRVQARDARRAAIESAKMAARSKIEEAKTKLKERLSTIRDEQKKRRVERVSDRLNQINEKLVGVFANGLEKLSEANAKIADKASGLGDSADLSAVKELIASADSLIAVASEAVKVQAAKTYSVADAIGDEKTLKNDITPVRNQLKTDLSAVRDQVKAAKNAVRAAATALAQVAKTENASGTPTQ